MRPLPPFLLWCACPQDGVPECLEALSGAGIKIWVLTGDKVRLRRQRRGRWRERPIQSCRAAAWRIPPVPAARAEQLPPLATPPPCPQVETAISIAYSCRLFTEEMAVVELRESHVSANTRRSRADLQADIQQAQEVGRRGHVHALLAWRPRLAGVCNPMADESSCVPFVRALSPRFPAAISPLQPLCSHLSRRSRQNWRRYRAKTRAWE